MTPIINWLKTNTHGFDHLSNEEVNAISDFSLLWSLFEARILNTRGSARAICDAVDGWLNAGVLDIQVLAPELAYFQQRYFADGDFTYHFHHLHFRNNDQQALVEAVIEGSNTNPRDQVAAALIIVFRFRNNLFHGVKWQYQLADQLGNFTAANNALMKVLEKHGTLAEG
ncbi:hypothetical protein JQV19_06090 [Sulfitobacter mediterraneus]|nr:hypothetical protein [Sulfitobacter mediterraneus]MBM1567744.1 hypothetical protein [Sulfitobacter mediterraneus]MBM1571572.1 hypothetical protein [Sulfitobacter mediterraneus]MBM1575360.1 hypothetical protein [Sulfitobacter mediterraneus]MBM1579149.1 hypothetical protein [Sulfitobacter mediterraneus]